MTAEYHEHVKAVFPHRIEVGTLPGAGESTYVVLGVTLESNGFKAVFALTTIEAWQLIFDLIGAVDDVEGTE